MPAAPFQPGTELSGAFHRRVVAPLLTDHPHAAALLGWGSDVLGHDTPRSTDHGWGPRLLVLLDDPGAAPEVQRLLDAGLPDTFEGWPVRFGWDDVQPRHHVSVTTLSAWLVEHLGVDASTAMTTLDWLLTPQQRLLGVVAGAVYADPRGTLDTVRRRLAWYPDQVERWVLACQWHRLAQEEAFVARTAEVGDLSGSAVIAARLVRDMMRLALLPDRRYAPYGKWLGTAFARVPSQDALPDHLQQVLDARAAPDRAAALARAWTALADRHNARGLTAPVPVTIGPYFSRPAQVLMADRFTDALLDSVTDPFLRTLPPIGTVDQVTDDTDLLAVPTRYRRLAALYVAEEAEPRR